VRIAHGWPRLAGREAETNGRTIEGGAGADHGVGDYAGLMTDQQFTTLLWHLRAAIILLGLAVGILLAFAWEYL
jgi:hypothetical protein